jgi:hypothetical protein
MDGEKRRWKPIGQHLKEMELLTEGQLQEGLDLQRRQGGLIGEILISLGYLNEEEVLLALAVQQGVDLEAGSVTAWRGPVALFLLPQGRTRQLYPPYLVPLSKPIGDLAGQMLFTALRAGASEFRLEMSDFRCDARYSVDGILTDLDPPPAHLAAPLLAHLKWHAGMDPFRSDQPQSSEGELRTGSERCFVEMSATPLISGELLVLSFRRA